MNINFKKIYFNLTKNKPKVVEDFIAVLNNESQLQQVSGILFKSNYIPETETIHLAFVPNIYEGERNYHYNIKMKYEDEFNLVGSISANGEFKILMKPASPTLTNEENNRYLLGMYAFTSFLVSSGFTEDGKLDWTTTEILKALGLTDSIPDCIHSLNKCDFLNKI